MKLRCAAILVELGRSREARHFYISALRVFRRELGPNDYEVGAVLANLGALYSIQVEIVTQNAPSAWRSRSLKERLGRIIPGRQRAKQTSRGLRPAGELRGSRSPVSARAPLLRGDTHRTHPGAVLVGKTGRDCVRESKMRTMSRVPASA